MQRARFPVFFVLHSAFCIGLFLALALPQLSLPGLHYDEAKEAGVNAMQLVAGQPLTAFREATIQIGPWRLPLMVQDYIGALNVLLALPFLALGGVTVSALRGLSLLIGVLTLVISGRVALRLAGRSAAVITCVLLAVNPTFVFWSRQGIFVTNLTMLLFVASLLTALRWWQTRRNLDLWLTAFLWGLGLYAKLLFVWAIVALVVVGALVWAWGRVTANQRIGESANRRISESANRQIGKSASEAEDRCHTPYAIRHSPLAVRSALIAIVCFLLPLIPLILFNLQTSGTFVSIFGNLGRSYYGVDNRAYLPNLLQRLDQLRILLQGNHLWYLGEVYANPLAPWLMAVAAGLGCLLWALPRLRGAVAGASRHPVTSALRSGQALLPFALLALIVAQSAFTVSDLFITHFALALPLIPLSLGTLAGRLLSNVSRQQHPLPVRLAVSALAIGAAIGWGAGDLGNTLRYQQILAVSGGYGTHSDAIYSLTRYLDQQSPSAPLALDWGIDAPVRYLTSGRVNPIEVFGYDRMDAPDGGFTGRVAPFLANPDNLYVAHTDEFVIFRGRAEALAQEAAAYKMRLVEVARFSERSGRPLFIVYRAW